MNNCPKCGGPVHGTTAITEVVEFKSERSDGGPPLTRRLPGQRTWKTEPCGCLLTLVEFDQLCAALRP